MPSMKAAVGRAAAAVLSLAPVALVSLLALGLVPGCSRKNEAEKTAAGSQPRVIEVDRFSARLEKSDDKERLIVSFRLRSSLPEALGCYVFVVARADRATPKLWAIWPTQNPGLAISAGGNFHAAHPSSGHLLQLGDSWSRIDATLPRTVGQPPFDFAVVYVVAPDGNILLAHPFPL